MIRTLHEKTKHVPLGTRLLLAGVIALLVCAIVVSVISVIVSTVKLIFNVLVIVLLLSAVAAAWLTLSRARRAEQ